MRSRQGPAGASAGGAVVFYAVASRQSDDQTQADKDQLRLTTETHSPQVRTVVRELLCGITVSLHFICFVIFLFTYMNNILVLLYCCTYKIKQADFDLIRELSSSESKSVVRSRTHAVGT